MKAPNRPRAPLWFAFALVGHLSGRLYAPIPEPAVGKAAINNSTLCGGSTNETGGMVESQETAFSETAGYSIDIPATGTMRNATMIDNGQPWRDTAPVIDTSIPDWLNDYVKFHQHELKHNARDASYLIFTCTNRRDAAPKFQRCSGTGNRQRSIAAAFLVAMLTDRVLLIDIDNPVPLDRILEPHLLQWNARAVVGDAEVHIFARNLSPAVLDQPDTFERSRLGPVVRLIANGPTTLKAIWESKAMSNYLKERNIHKQTEFPEILAKWIFYTLYRPSLALTTMLQKQSGILFDEQSSSFYGGNYTAVHLRMGGEWGDSTRYKSSELAPFLEAATSLPFQFKKTNETSSSYAIVVVSDSSEAKLMFQELSPQHVKVADTTIMHVDKVSNQFKRNSDSVLEGSLNVWVDVLLLAQSSCLVLSDGSFSRLALQISQPSDGSKRCSEKISSTGY